MNAKSIRNLCSNTVKFISTNKYDIITGIGIGGAAAYLYSSANKKKELAPLRAEAEAGRRNVPEEEKSTFERAYNLGYAVGYSDGSDIRGVLSDLFRTIRWM